MRGIRVTECDTHEEAIELRFRQCKSAELLVGVLSCNDEERLGQAVCCYVGADLTLLHRLEQRALRAWARPIDFIGEQQLCEDRALSEMKLLAGAIEDRD